MPVHEPFGNVAVPYAEPAWYYGSPTPYFEEKHAKFRSRVRAFVDKEVRPFVDKWEEDFISKGIEMPMEVFRKAAAAGLYAPMWDEELGGTPPEGGWDFFMDMIWNDELARIGAGGVGSGFSIHTMALPPIINFGSDYLKEKVVKDVLQAKKFISLAISEPYAGSDVANIRTTAVKNGDHYILNGEKKWITWAQFADYFTVAARTGGPGMGGITMFLVERNMPGVKTRRMKLQGNWTGGTCYVTFEDVKVPEKNIIGELNGGFQIIVQNFNHERYVIAVSTCRGARMLIEEAIEYARRRKTFGKLLSKTPVIRHKIADMAQKVEATQAFLEQLTYMLNEGMGPLDFGRYVALAKVQSSKTIELCAREASQILGGASYVRDGKGQFVERAYREVRAAAIPGGSEEIMQVLAMNLAKL